jgi:hypothetical protein
LPLQVAAEAHSIPSGGAFELCPGKQDVRAITPDISYTGARIGPRHGEAVTGPPPAGAIDITELRNVDHHLAPV